MEPYWSFFPCLPLPPLAILHSVTKQPNLSVRLPSPAPGSFGGRGKKGGRPLEARKQRGQTPLLPQPLTRPPIDHGFITENPEMAKSRGDFTEILVQRQVVSPDQLEEARGLERQAGMKLHDAIVKLGYASTDQV